MIGAAAAADLASSFTGPIVAAAGAATAAFAASGAALGAFGLAVIPQFSDISDSAKLYTQAMDAQAQGSADAAKKMQAYKESLAAMPPATRATAVALNGAREALKNWSTSLAPTTMPIFTRGLNLVSAILPKLTPLVRIAAASLDDFMASIERGVKGGGLDGFMAKLNKAAADSLPRILGVLKNLGAGIAGILAAFMPFSGQMAGGLERLTAKFAAWGRSLGDNPAFQEWMQDMISRAPTILGLLGDLAQILINVSQAMAPFTGLTLALTAALANFVASIPQGVMDWLAPTIMGIVLAIKAWAVVQGVLNVALAANPIGLVVVAIAALAAGLIYAYKHSETFRNVVHAAFGAIEDAVMGLKDKAGPVVEAIAQFFTDTLPAAFDEGVGRLLEVVGRVDEAVAQVKEKLAGLGSGDALSAGLAGARKKRGGLLDIIAPELAHPEEFIGLFKNVIGEVTGVVKGFARKWTARLGLEGLGSVKDIAERAKDAAFGFARRAYRALLRASFPGSGVVKGAVRAAVNFARGRYRATLRAAEYVSGVVRRVLGWLRSIPRTVTVAIRALMPNLPDLPFFAAGGISHAAGGGPRGNLTWVGEQGRELVKLPFGSTVYPHGQSEQMAAGGGGAGDVIVRLVVDGKELAEVVFDPLKRKIRKRSGRGPDSVQLALGGG